MSSFRAGITLPDPAEVAKLPPQALPGLLAALAAVQGAVAARLASCAPPVGALITADEAGKRLGLSVKEVYRRAHRWPFTRRLGPKTLRFDTAGLELFLGRRPEP